MDEELALVPDLTLLKYRHLLSVPDYENKENVMKTLMLAIEEGNMTNFYLDLCDQFKWKQDSNLVNRMKSENEKTLKELDAKIEDATENLGESEVREALLAKAIFYAKIGDKDNALSALRLTTEKTVASGQKLDIIFAQIRIGFFHDDLDLVRRNIEVATDRIEQEGDWERRNRLKIYTALEALRRRNFEKAADLFTETLATFTSYEIIDFETYIFYTVVSSMVALDRVSLKKKVIDSPEVLSVVHKIGNLDTFLKSYYDGEYQMFFDSLLSTLKKFQHDYFLHPHERLYCREMRIKAYSQFLESYRSVQLKSMAERFGVSESFIDRELAQFIAAGRLSCTIDKVGGVITTNRSDTRNAYYQQILKSGDLLFNKIQKLSRVINL